MPSFSKRSRAYRPHYMLPKWRSLSENWKNMEEAFARKTRELSSTPIEFFRQVVGFEPTAYQKIFITLFQQHQFVAARWCRQSGKTWIISALILWYAVTHPDSYIVIVAPSWRQSKLVLRRIGYFARKLPSTFILKIQRTIIYLTNGSIIEALPNNPEGIRGYTLHLIYWDEANLTPGDTELYDAILFALGTTAGKFVVSSTPWNTDSVFWRICNDPAYKGWRVSHVTWRDAQEPNGPLKKSILEEIRRQYEEDPVRWRREMEAEWAEDQDVWLSQSLIAKCIDKDLELYPFESIHKGKFYAGVDFGKHQDYSVLAVVQNIEDCFCLVHLKIFPLETSYASVIGYLKALSDRWGGFQKIRVDMTGVGDYICEDMENAGIENVEGVLFTLSRKQEMASLLKQRMLEGKFKFPYFTWEKPYHSDYPSELNVERFQLRKDGTITFSHPRGTHNDVFWATALALYGTAEMKPEPYLAVVPR
ncbi:MAG: terminase family protein [Candidatus Bathyarchaeia archaeon]